MAELAAARCALGDSEELMGLGCLEDEHHSGQDPCTTLEAEVKHLELDITHYQEQVDHLQIEERKRTHELGLLRSELSDISEQLAYEQQTVRHHQVTQQLDLETSSSASLANAGIGRRTMEVKAEKRLREAAEQRTGRLARHVTRLAGDTAHQQAAIDELSRKLGRVRNVLDQRDRQLSSTAHETSELQAKLFGGPRDTSASGIGEEDTAETSYSQGGAEGGNDMDNSGAASMDTAERAGAEQEAANADDSSPAAKAGDAAPPGRARGLAEKPRRPPRKNKSTGRLPHLSF
mmetsp:Transcript_54773/g.123633  ORF Transcript_54773/g.123633 Transcript_54773/m.123633 type:complete len:291 (-) Transcript_54773:65-937(-)